MDKAKWNLKDKSEAINLVAEMFEEEVLDPELRPEAKQDFPSRRHQAPERFRRDFQRAQPEAFHALSKGHNLRKPLPCHRRGTLVLG